MKKQALLSVSDKTGIVDFARELVALGCHAFFLPAAPPSSSRRKAWLWKKSQTTLASLKCSTAA